MNPQHKPSLEALWDRLSAEGHLTVVIPKNQETKLRQAMSQQKHRSNQALGPEDADNRRIVASSRPGKNVDEIELEFVLKSKAQLRARHTFDIKEIR